MGAMGGPPGNGPFGTIAAAAKRYSGGREKKTGNTIVSRPLWQLLAQHRRETCLRSELC